MEKTPARPRDVDAVAVKIAAFDDHIAKIDSDAQQDAPIFRYAGAGLFHPPLKVHRALHRINGAAELCVRGARA